MAERFYTPDRLGPGEYHLRGPEAHHLTTVRRFSPGDRITLFNGDGNEYAAEIIAVGKKSASLNILSVSPVDRELPFPLVIASALPKGDRADYLIEKITELGVTSFVPLITARSVVVPKQPVVEKFTRAVIEASKQCGRNRLMAIDLPRRWGELLDMTGPGSRIVLHPDPGAPRLTEAMGAGSTIAVGPEGGFSDEEVKQALAAGWRVAGLGGRVLRVETAAVAAAALVAISNPVASASRALP
jgi:16S rRNA (uracil1498-N3)-methyltransferase